MQFQRILRLSLSALILLILLLNTTGVFRYPAVDQLENWTYDARLNLSRPNTLDDRIVIVDIDEFSLAEVERWPWSRDKLATLVDNLFNHYGASVVGFDIVFAEKDESSGLSVFENLARDELSNNPQYLEAFTKIRPSLEFDRIFANSLRGEKAVMGYYFRHSVPQGESGVTGLLPPPIFKMDAQWSKRLSINKAMGYAGNLEVIQSAAASGGYFDNPLVSEDGVFRRVPLVQNYEGNLYPSLALATAQVFLGNPEIELGVKTSGSNNDQKYYSLQSINLGDHRIPVDNDGAAYVPYRGLQGSFPYFSIHQILTRNIDPALLKDKIVLVGATAPGLLDLRSTPVQNIYAGVEVQANLISGILDQSINHRPVWTIGYEFKKCVTYFFSAAN